MNLIDIWLGLPLAGKLLTVALAVYVVLSVAVGPHRAGQVWRRFGHALGDTLARIVLTLFYFLVMPPFALATRLSRDVLGTRSSPPAWRPAEPAPATVDEARRQH